MGTADLQKQADETGKIHIDGEKHKDFQKIEDLTCLDQFSELNELQISNCFNLCKFAGVEKQPSLEKISIFAGNLFDLTFPFFTNNHKLQQLTVEYNNSLCSLSGLKGAKNLKKLKVCHCKIKEIDKSLKQLGLTYLNCSDNKIEEMDGVAQLITLIDLKLSINLIIDIPDLSSLINLRSLDLSSNYISDITGLKGLNLHTLILSQNEIERLGNLKKMTNLKILFLDCNKIADVDQLVYLLDLKQLKEFHIFDNPLIDDEDYDTKVFYMIPTTCEDVRVYEDDNDFPDCLEYCQDIKQDENPFAKKIEENRLRDEKRALKKAQKEEEDIKLGLTKNNESKEMHDKPHVALLEFRKSLKTNKSNNKLQLPESMEIVKKIDLSQISTGLLSRLQEKREYIEMDAQVVNEKRKIEPINNDIAELQKLFDMQKDNLSKAEQSKETKVEQIVPEISTANILESTEVSKQQEAPLINEIVEIVKQTNEVVHESNEQPKEQNEPLPEQNNNLATQNEVTEIVELKNEVEKLKNELRIKDELLTDYLIQIETLKKQLSQK
ncbi:Conserved_hypothetical protein [Hexamita inflata]|uniref:Uncharacterized protein n=1 Tax=Hexamita inflata TaxID=28002 RepID=A0AA86RG05_9EUKA|nr:Conserved hypothetical protein [Hexamita inflata]CAI9975787.1 Conserved hypothetical protein [Hexamita inflata]